ncbi:MAG: M48 family metallopeptidase [Brachybacterium sp.]|nr:M48 family metallopeptidase [Brachybacterium sp.]
MSYPPSTSAPGPGSSAGPTRTSASEGMARPRPNLINGATIHGITGQKAMRHPWELPLLGLGIAITVIAYTLWFLLVAVSIVNLIRGSGPTLLTLMEGPGAGLVGQIFAVVMLLPLILWIARAILYAQPRVQGIRMSPTQFPEGYRMVAEASQQFGLRKVPDAYVVSGGGVVNAFASGHGFRRFVVFHSDLFEVGGKVRDPDALRFVAAHEVGHLAAGHVSYFRLLFVNLLMQIPILGPAFSRSQEYTADNFGYVHCPRGAAGVVALLGAGKYLNADVNVNELADRAATEKGLWAHIVNWLASHPVITWRAHALRDRTRPGHLWFRPGFLGRSPGATFTSALPAGGDYTGAWPTPAQVLAMLDQADTVRPPGMLNQFGRFPGVDYSDRPTAREVQTSAPLPVSLPPAQADTSGGAPR